PLLAQADWWRAVGPEAAELPPTGLAQPTLTARLAPGVTRALPGRTADVLLAAAATALAATPGLLGVTAAATVLVDVEGHGRLDPGRPLNLDRTVGWFTTVYPVAVTLGADFAATLADATTALRQTPDGGLGYRLLAQQGAIPERRPPLLVNYHGDIGAAGLPAGWNLSDWPVGTTVSPANPPDHALTLTAALAHGGLDLRLDYAAPVTADAARNYLDALAATLTRAAEADATGQAAPSVTPADLARPDGPASPPAFPTPPPGLDGLDAATLAALNALAEGGPA
ncbi:MAG: condensation domain-containing protein, partial [Propionibacteriaceae bacterium]|nr:condensation domain-containing protein [Propionibacteriaceae bacterium]